MYIVYLSFSVLPHLTVFCSSLNLPSFVPSWTFLNLQIVDCLRQRIADTVSLRFDGVAAASVLCFRPSECVAFPQTAQSGLLPAMVDLAHSRFRLSYIVTMVITHALACFMCCTCFAVFLWRCVFIQGFENEFNQNLQVR